MKARNSTVFAAAGAVCAVAVCRWQCPAAWRVSMLCPELRLRCALAFDVWAQKSPAIRGQTDLEIAVKASDDVNPDGKGRAVFSLVQLHELHVGAVLEAADYFSLEQAEWRAVHAIEPAPEAAWCRIALPANKARLRIELQGQGVRIIPLE